VRRLSPCVVAEQSVSQVGNYLLEDVRHLQDRAVRPRWPYNVAFAGGRLGYNATATMAAAEQIRAFLNGTLRYADALPHLWECVSRAPNMRAARVWLAATYAQLGQLDNARAQAAEVLRIEPFFTINRSPPVPALKRADDIEHVASGLRKAGLPES
jgi:Tetratricopeptide repeat